MAEKIRRYKLTEQQARSVLLVAGPHMRRVTVSHLMVISDSVRRGIDIYLVLDGELAYIAEKRGTFEDKPVFMDIAVLDRQRAEDWMPKQRLVESA